MVPYGLMDVLALSRPCSMEIWMVALSLHTLSLRDIYFYRPIWTKCSVLSLTTVGSTEDRRYVLVEPVRKVR